MAATLKEKTHRCHEDCIHFPQDSIKKFEEPTLSDFVAARAMEKTIVFVNIGKRNCYFSEITLFLSSWMENRPWFPIASRKPKHKEAFLTWDALDSLFITTTAHKKDGGRLLGGSPRHVAGSCNPGITGSSLRERGI